MANYVPGILIHGGIYHYGRNKEMKIEVVSERKVVAGPPLHRWSTCFGSFSHLLTDTKQGQPAVGMGQVAGYSFGGTVPGFGRWWWPGSHGGRKKKEDDRQNNIYVFIKNNNK